MVQCAKDEFSPERKLSNFVKEKETNLSIVLQPKNSKVNQRFSKTFCVCSMSRLNNLGTFPGASSYSEMQNNLENLKQINKIISTSAHSQDIKENQLKCINLN